MELYILSNWIIYISSAGNYKGKSKVTHSYVRIIKYAYLSNLISTWFIFFIKGNHNVLPFMNIVVVGCYSLYKNK